MLNISMIVAMLLSNAYVICMGMDTWQQTASIYILFKFLVGVATAYSGLEDRFAMKPI